MKSLTRSISPYRSNRLAISAFCGALMFGSVMTNTAKTITIEFVGELNSVPIELAPSLVAGDEITGTFTYDSSAPQTAFFSGERDLPVGGSAAIGSYAFTFSGLGDNPGRSLRFAQKFPPVTSTDVIQIETRATGSPVNGYSLGSIGLRLAEGVSLLPDLSNLPLDPLPLNEGLFIHLHFDRDTPFPGQLPLATLSGVTTSLRVLTPSAVPDAGGSLPLLGLACTALAWVRRTATPGAPSGSRVVP